MKATIKILTGLIILLTMVIFAVPVFAQTNVVPFEVGKPDKEALTASVGDEVSFIFEINDPNATAEDTYTVSFEDKAAEGVTPFDASKIVTTPAAITGQDKKVTVIIPAELTKDAAAEGQHSLIYTATKNGEETVTAQTPVTVIIQAVKSDKANAGLTADDSTDVETMSDVSVAYRTHVQNVGWQPYVTNGIMAGTSGRSLRLEGMNIHLQNQPYSGNIEYRTHIQNIGWESSWKTNGTMSGTSGRGLRLEAMQVRLTGEMANHYDVYYRVHAQNFGWLSWAKNGKEAGTAGFGYRLEALQVVLVTKGGTIPSSSPASNRSEAFVQLTLEQRAYNPIIEKYNHAIAANYTQNQYINEDLCETLTREFDGPWKAARYFGYALMDLDGDGIRELMIGETGKPNIYDMYTIKNGQAKRVFLSHTRSRYNYAGMNKIIFEGSNGASSNMAYLYEYHQSLTQIDGSKSIGFYNEATQYYVFVNNNWRQSNQSEYTSKYQSLSQLKKNYEMTLFPASSK
ncbi:MAG: Ig domain-containing protein [Eubacteriaceae bacterium]|nr:Ig domain-containing protein [Eubacteriaceae bacterium]